MTTREVESGAGRGVRMKHAFVVERRVQFAETDMAGVLHFANYYRMMEEVEHAFWRSVGSSVLSTHGGQEISWPRVATSCEYFAPARFEDVLTLSFSVVNVGDRSVTFEVEFLRGTERLALGRTTAVCCTMSAVGFESVPIPASLRALLEASRSGARATP